MIYTFAFQGTTTVIRPKYVKRRPKYVDDDEYAYWDLEEYTIKNKHQAHSPSSASLIFTSHQIRHEALPLFYQFTTFDIDVCMRARYACAVIGPENSCMIRSIVAGHEWLCEEFWSGHTPYCAVFPGLEQLRIIYWDHYGPVIRDDPGRAVGRFRYFFGRPDMKVVYDEQPGLPGYGR
jgi:hypothetical protein